MKLGRLNHIGVATPSVADLPVIASGAKQSSVRVDFGSGLPRFARNDWEG